MKNLLSLLEEQRKEAGLTYKEVAIKAGIKADTVRGIMQGWQSPKYETLLALANALDIEVKVVARAKGGIR